MADDDKAIDRVKSDIGQLSRDVAVITNEMKNLSKTVDEGLRRMDDTFKDVNARYATKEDLKGVAEELKVIRTNLSKGVWIVMTFVVMAVLAAAFKNGYIRAG